MIHVSEVCIADIYTWGSITEVGTAWSMCEKCFSLFKRYVGLFCGNVGLFGGNIGLFHGYPGVRGASFSLAGMQDSFTGIKTSLSLCLSCFSVFCRYTGLFCGNIGLFCGYPWVRGTPLSLAGIYDSFTETKTFLSLRASCFSVFRRYIGLFGGNIKLFRG